MPPVGVHTLPGPARKSLSDAMALEHEYVPLMSSALRVHRPYTADSGPLTLHAEPVPRAFPAGLWPCASYI